MILLAEHAVAALTTPGAGLTRDTLPGLLMATTARITAELDLGEQLDRRASVVAKAAAAHILRFCQPVTLTQADPQWVATAVRDRNAGATLVSRRRIAWSAPGGIDFGLMLDRVHHTHLPDLLLDEWMTRKVASDLAAGQALVGDAFLGVRVIAHRAPYASLHVTGADGALHHHLLGGCEHCTGQVI